MFQVIKKKKEKKKKKKKKKESVSCGENDVLYKNVSLGGSSQKKKKKLFEALQCLMFRV